MRGWLGAVALCTWLSACGPLHTREQRTVFAPPLPAARSATAAAETAPAKSHEPEAPDARARHVLDHWVRPLQVRDLAPLIEAFSEDCLLTLLPAADQSGRHATREGQLALRDFLQGHVLAYPYTSVRVVYAGASARIDMDFAELELLDACGAVLLRLDAKLRIERDHYAAVELRAHELPPRACSR